MLIELPSLYGHQAAMRDSSRTELAAHRRIILCAPPGCGKTRIAKVILGSSAIREAMPTQSGNSLFTVHRRGLVDNASNSFDEAPRLPHGNIMSGKQPTYGHRVQVASIDTLLSWFIENGRYETNVSFDLIVFDECVSGDSLVETDKGIIRIDQIPAMNPSMVKSFSTKRGVHFSRILNWKHSGFRETIVIHSHHGKIRCTPDHEIYTRRGWLHAKDLLSTDEILACAAVDRNCCHPTSSQDTAIPVGLLHNNGNRRLMRSISMRHHARVGVGSQLASPLQIGANGRRRGISTRRTMRKVTPSARVTSLSNSRRWRGRQFSERFSAIRPSSTRIPKRNHRDCVVHTATNSLRGRSTRLTSCTGSMRRLASRLMTVTGKCRYAQSQRAIRASLRYSNSCAAAVGKGYRENGWTASGILDSHGGLPTMGVPQKQHSCSIRRVSPRKSVASLPSGSVIQLVERPCAELRDGTPSTSPVGHKSKLDGESNDSHQSACDTNWSRVTRIDRVSAADVYDIEVEDSHCFFANGLLVHNCHSHHSKLMKFLAYHDAYREEQGLHPAYLIGLSATPQAKGLADLYKTIVQGPSTQWLIDNGFLSPFRYFRATQGKLGLLVKRGDKFTEESEAAAMDGLAGDLVRDWKRLAEGRPTVGFFPRIKHAQDAMTLLSEAGLRVAYVDGDTSDDDRLRIFRDLNEHRIDYLCNVQVVERGTDIPAISCVQMCVAVCSIVRWRQMIGRGSRIHTGKQDCIVLDHGGSLKRGMGLFEDDGQWSLDTTTKETGEVGVRPTIECPKCHAIYRGGLCRNCGYEPSRNERTSQGLEFDGSELVEVKKGDKTKTKAKSAEDLMISCLYASGKSGRTWSQCCGMFRGKCRSQGTPAMRVPKSVEVGGCRYEMLRFGSLDSCRRVAALFPFTVERGSHGGEYHRQTADLFQKGD